VEKAIFDQPGRRHPSLPTRVPRRRPFQTLAMIAICVLVLGSTFARAQNAADDDLVKLARNHFNYDSMTSEQEREAFDVFFQNVHAGKRTDFRPENSPDEDVAKGDLWGPERTIKADWIVWLCKDPNAVKMVQSSGVDVDGAKIDGKVDLSWLSMQFHFVARHCYFSDRIELYGASTRGFSLLSAYIHGPSDSEKDRGHESLNAATLTVEGRVSLYGSKIAGIVSFRNAKIADTFSAESASFTQLKRPLDLSFANFGAGVNFRFARADGGVDFSNAEIKGELDCYDAQITEFDGHSMKVSGDLALVLGFRGEVKLNLRRSAIGGDLYLVPSKSSVGISANVIASFFAATIGGGFYLDGFGSSGERI
jgi:hypothetical protein